MSRKLAMIAVGAALVCIGTPSSGQAPGEPGRSDCRGEASYTTNSTGVPFDVSFDFALRDEGGEDLGWAMVRTSGTPGVGFDPQYNAAARVRSVEFHGDIAIFLVVWERGTSGALGQILGLGTNDVAGVASIVGLRDGASLGFTDQVSESFFWPPDQVPADPNGLLDVEALDDFGQPFQGFEGVTVRDYIVAQLTDLRGNPIHPGGDVQVSGGP